MFPPTLPEREGAVDRRKLLSLTGRSRRPQIELAEELGIRDYPCPTGGCLLTDTVIASRLQDLFAHTPDFGITDVHLLKVGRHFRIQTALKDILGRNETENVALTRGAKLAEGACKRVTSVSNGLVGRLAEP